MIFKRVNAFVEDHDPPPGHLRVLLVQHLRVQSRHAERESLAAPGAFAGTAAVRCDVSAPAITGAKLLRNGLESVTFTGRQL